MQCNKDVEEWERDYDDTHADMDDDDDDDDDDVSTSPDEPQRENLLLIISSFRIITQRKYFIRLLSPHTSDAN